jgi:Phosphatidyl serine synthase
MGWLVPQFKECWWDSLLVDVLGANLIGMALGLTTLRFLENKVCMHLLCML